RLADDLLMAKMDTVEEADGEADLAVAGFQLAGGVDEFHPPSRLRPRGRLRLRFRTNANCFPPILILLLIFILISACRRQFQKWNHTLLQSGGGKPQHLVERLCVGHIEFAGGRAAERGQMRAAADFLAEVVSKAADIG